MQEVWLLHLAACSFLTGLIWVIQWVHYALFDRVGHETWRAYHDAHTKRISMIVVPAMLLELVTVLILVLRPLEGLAAGEAYALGLLTCLIWLSTFAIQVPLHGQLAALQVPSLPRIQKLVLSNWIRTIAWSLKCLLCFQIQWRWQTLGFDRFS